MRKKQKGGDCGCAQSHGPEGTTPEPEVTPNNATPSFFSGGKKHVLKRRSKGRKHIKTSRARKSMRGGSLSFSEYFSELTTNGGIATSTANIGQLYKV